MFVSFKTSFPPCRRSRTPFGHRYICSHSWPETRSCYFSVFLFSQPLNLLPACLFQVPQNSTKIREVFQPLILGSYFIQTPILSFSVETHHHRLIYSYADLNPLYLFQHKKLSRVKSTSSKPANKVPVIFTSCWFIWFGGNA